MVAHCGANMRIKHLLVAIGFAGSMFAETAAQATCPAWHTLTNGTTADATQVMDNFNVILGCPNFTGNVGVGISTPSTKLEVSGAEILGSNVGNNELALDSSGANYGFLSNRGVGIWSLGYGPTLGTLGTAVLTWNSSGYVGIGTTTPATKLDVYQTSQSSAAEGTGSLILSNASARRVELGYDNTIDAGFIRAYQSGVAARALVLNPGGGSVGIGTTTPQSGTTLNVSSNTGSAAAFLVSGTTGVRINGALTTAEIDGVDYTGTGSYQPLLITGSQLQLGHSGSADVTISSGGNMGIGTTSPLTSLQVGPGTLGSNFDNLAGGAVTPGVLNSLGSGVVAMGVSVSNGGTNPRAALVLNDTSGVWGLSETYSTSGYPFALSIGGLEKLRVTTGGNVGIGTTTPSYPLTVNGTAYATGAAGALSDRRHKTDIRPLSLDAVGIVMRLNPVTFAWIDPHDDGMRGEQIGFIAQDVLPVLPDAVLTMHNAEGTLGLKYDEFIPVLTKAIQQQQSEIATLQAADQREVATIARLQTPIAESNAIRELKLQVDLPAVQFARLVAANAALTEEVRAQSDAIRQLRTQMADVLRRSHLRTASN